MSKDLYVIAEQRDGNIAKVTLELLGEATVLAADLKEKVYAVLMGDNIKDKAQELIEAGADGVIVIDDPMLAEYVTEPYAKALTAVIKNYDPNIVLFGATSIGRDLAPRVAARVHTGLTADCTHLDIDMNKYFEFLHATSTADTDSIEKKLGMDDITLKMTRPAFGGHLMATIICPRFRPCMSTVRPGVMKKAPFSQERADACVVEKYPVSLTADDLKTQVLDVVKEAKQIVDLIGADVIVSVGRGIGKDIQKGIELAGQLADAFGGGVVGGSRVTIDSGWLSADHQVGQTGKTVHPKVYVALGISGAIQHKAGMQDSELIIAVNKDETAPIFEIADYGITGDLFKVVPLMIDALNAARASK